MRGEKQDGRRPPLSPLASCIFGRAQGHRPYTYRSPLNGLSPVAPRSWLNFHLTSRLWAAGRPSSLLRLTAYRCLIAFHIHAGEAEPRDGCEA